MAEHKDKIRKFETYLGVENALHLKIKEAVDPEGLKAIRSPNLGFTHHAPIDMLMHLRDGGGDLDYMDVTHLMTELTKPW